MAAVEVINAISGLLRRFIRYLVAKIVLKQLLRELCPGMVNAGAKYEHQQSPELAANKLSSLEQPVRRPRLKIALFP